jgi:cytochrome P450
LLSTKNDTIDLIHDFGKPLPAMTIGKILGLPAADYAYLKQQGSVMIKALDLYISFKDILRINEAAKSFIEYFKKVITEKELKPDNGIISRLIQLNKQEGVLNDDELISTCILLFIAGEETSVSLMGTGFYNLLQHPESLEELRKDQSKIPLAIEELMRYDAPIQIVGRIAGSDTELQGKTIKKGAAITICLGSANRDEDVFDKPDAFLLDRNPNKHLGFGGGAHYCLGDWLARIQTRMAIEALLNRYKNIELIETQPEWNSNLAIRCLTQLPVKIK